MGGLGHALKVETTGHAQGLAVAGREGVGRERERSPYLCPSYWKDGAAIFWMEKTREACLE